MADRSHKQESATRTESLFVSYSRKDKGIVTPVVKLMRLGQAPVFQDLDSIELGTKWRVELAESIAQASRLVVFWCSHSAKSKNVAWEVGEGIRSGKDIVPARMDSTPLPPALAEYQCLDLTSAVTHSRGLSRRLFAIATFVVLVSLGYLDSVGFFSAVGGSAYSSWRFIDLLTLGLMLGAVLLLGGAWAFLTSKHRRLAKAEAEGVTGTILRHFYTSPPGSER